MKIFVFSFIFGILILSYSCKLNGNFKGLYGYQKETIKECPGLVMELEKPICSIENTNNSIYPISGLELKSCILTFPAAIVYIWQPHCNSDDCISPIYLKEQCDKSNIELFVIAEYFDCEQMILNNILDRPIFGIDQEYYGTNLTSKYLTKFWNDLTGANAEISRSRFILFEYGKPRLAKSKIEEILIL